MRDVETGRNQKFAEARMRQSILRVRFQLKTRFQHSQHDDSNITNLAKLQLQQLLAANDKFMFDIEFAKDTHVRRAYL